MNKTKYRSTLCLAILLLNACENKLPENAQKKPNFDESILTGYWSGTDSRKNVKYYLNVTTSQTQVCSDGPSSTTYDSQIYVDDFSGRMEVAVNIYNSSHSVFQKLNYNNDSTNPNLIGDGGDNYKGLFSPDTYFTKTSEIPTCFSSLF